MLPLDIRQRKSSMKMVKIQPEIQSLQKRYANDPQNLQKKQQELMRREGVKPLAGCLPMLLQLPIFFAFFGALRVIAAEQTVALFLHAVNAGAEAVSLPQWLWVHNLWQADSGFVGVMPSAQEFLQFLNVNATYISPQTLSVLAQGGFITFGSEGLVVNTEFYNQVTSAILAANNISETTMNGWFILPILSGASMLLQQKMMTKSGAQMQQGKFMMYLFPIISVFICATSNTAFAIYWFVSNIYGVAQNGIIQWITTRKEKKKELSTT